MTSPLVVPIKVSALMVTNPVLQRGGFRRWSADFTKLGHNQPVEPPIGTGLDPAFTGAAPSALGVYLHWDLPDAFYHSTTNADGSVTFPQTPNRWLVMRWTPKGNKGYDRWTNAWIVESDYTPDGPADLTGKKFGRTVRIIRGDTPGDPWSEQHASDTSSLTAMGPGLHAFADFQPYNADVFSLHDDCADLQHNPTELMYKIIGWYANPADDILKKKWAYELGWGYNGSGIQRSVYSGTVKYLSWDPDADPADSAPKAIDIQATAGISSMDAVTTLATQALGTDNPDTGSIVSALLHGTLGQLDGPDGHFTTTAYAQDTAYSPRDGGTLWELADRDPGAGGEPRHAILWEIDNMNMLQRQKDDLSAELLSLQRRLHMIVQLSEDPAWADAGSPGTSDLDESNPDGYSGMIKAVQVKIKTIVQSGNLPDDPTPGQPDPAQSFKPLVFGDRYYPKRTHLPRYHRAKDPSVTLRGAGTIPDRDTSLQCRVKEDLYFNVQIMHWKILKRWIIDGATQSQNPYMGTFTGAALLPRMNPDDDIRDIINALIWDCWVGSFTGNANDIAHIYPVASAAMQTTMHALTMDELAPAFMYSHANAATMYPGVEPVYGGSTDTWTKQPWTPLYMEWRVGYTPVPIDQWEFDGTQWTIKPGRSDDLYPISGRTVLGKQANNTAKNAVTRYAQGAPASMKKALKELGATVSDWNLLSQSLDGLSAQLHCYDPAYMEHPAAGSLIGTGYAPGAPVPGQVGEQGASHFQEMRCGTARFTALYVVDRYGRSVKVLGKTDGGTQCGGGATKLLASDHLKGGFNRYKDKDCATITLAPRLPDASRTTVTMKDTILGWVVPSALDHSVQLYNVDGSPLGELRTGFGTTPDTPAKTVFSQLPGRTYPTPNAEVQKVIDLVSYGDGSRFTAFLSAVRDALRSIHPPYAPGSTTAAALYGRPLALVRLRVSIDTAIDPVQGSGNENRTVYPLADPTWKNAGQHDQKRAYRDLKWPVRLGEYAQLADGLVGYFTDADKFASPLPLTPGKDGLVVPIGTGADFTVGIGINGARETLALIDPSGTVHATTGLMPIGKLDIPHSVTDAALAKIAPEFHAGPVLTDDPDATPVLSLPIPAHKYGDWQWIEREPLSGAWQVFQARANDEDEAVPSVPVTARSGFFALKGDQH